MRKFLEWCIYFFGGHRVLDFLEAQATLYDNTRPRSQPMRAIPRSVFEIANATYLSEWRVRMSLRRLLRQHLVERAGPHHWRVVLRRIVSHGRDLYKKSACALAQMPGSRGASGAGAGSGSGSRQYPGRQPHRRRGSRFWCAVHDCARAWIESCPRAGIGALRY